MAAADPLSRYHLKNAETVRWFWQSTSHIFSVVCEKRGTSDTSKRDKK